MGNIPTGIYTQRSNPANRGMNYNQLVEAANLLGTHTNNVIQARNIPTSAPARVTRVQANNQQILDQVVRLNSSIEPVVKAKNNSLTLANLSEAEIQSLLKKN